MTNTFENDVYGKIELPSEPVKAKLDVLYKELLVKVVDYIDMPETIKRLEEWFERVGLPSDRTATYTQVSEASGSQDPQKIEHFMNTYTTYVNSYHKYISEQKEPKELKLIQQQVNFLLDSMDGTASDMKPLIFKDAGIDILIPIETIENEIKFHQEKMIDLLVSDRVVGDVIKQYEAFFETNGYIYDRPMTQQEFIDLCPEKEDPVKVENWKTAYTNEWLEYEPMKERYETKEHIIFKQYVIDWLKGLLV